jgi:uncharacterized protein (TIGR03643 family)
MKSDKLIGSDLSRIVEMAWEDRTPFDAIEASYGLNEKDVIGLMRKTLKTTSFKLWRKRVAARKTKHLKLRGFKIGRFRCYTQKNR